MKIAAFILLAIVIFAVRIGLRMAIRGGFNAVSGGGNQPMTLTCPHCNSTHVAQAGGHWDCRSCGRMF